MRKAVATLAATVALIGGAVAPASAASWIPQEPKSPQPIGWGADCAVVHDRDTIEIWTWLTFSLTGSDCVKRAEVRA